MLTRRRVTSALLLLAGCASTVPTDRGTEPSHVASPAEKLAPAPTANVVPNIATPRTPESASQPMPTRTPPLAPGTLAPMVSLRDQRGITISVQKALEAGPAALIFYRGRW